MPYEVLILTKFHEDWTKIEEILLIANFWMCAVFFCSVFILNGLGVIIDFVQIDSVPMVTLSPPHV